MAKQRQIYGEIHSKSDMQKVFSEIRRDVDRAKSRPVLTELYKRAGYMITLTHAPSWETVLILPGVARGLISMSSLDAGIAPPPPPIGMQQQAADSGRVRVTWNNPVLYDSLELTRGYVPVGTLLPGGTTEVLDYSPGPHDGYRLVGWLQGMPSDVAVPGTVASAPPRGGGCCRLGGHCARTSVAARSSRP